MNATTFIQQQDQKKGLCWSSNQEELSVALDNYASLAIAEKYKSLIESALDSADPTRKEVLPKTQSVEDRLLDLWRIPEQPALNWDIFSQNHVLNRFIHEIDSHFGIYGSQLTNNFHRSAFISRLFAIIDHRNLEELIALIRETYVHLSDSTARRFVCDFLEQPSREREFYSQPQCTPWTGGPPPITPPGVHLHMRDQYFDHEIQHQSHYFRWELLQTRFSQIADCIRVRENQLLEFESAILDEVHRRNIYSLIGTFQHFCTFQLTYQNARHLAFEILMGRNIRGIMVE